MATFLQLVKDVGRDTGTLPNWASLTTLVSPSERTQKIMAWVIEAWHNIQNEREDWKWMREAVFTSPTLTAGTAAYTPSDLGIAATFGDWIEDTPSFSPLTIYDNDEGLEDETELLQISYEEWLTKWGRQTHDNMRPTEWAIRPYDNTILLGATPDLSTYKLRGHYQSAVQTLAVDADIPELPVRFHNLIKWEAIRLLQLNDGGFDEMSLAGQEIVRLRNQMNRELLPEIKIG